MSEIDKLKSAAEILKQVDVTDMITNLGIGIAKAQKALDDNSVQQAIAMADPIAGLGGKSLLELGFTPAFYSFQYADVSAEIELKMRLATEFEIGGSLSVDFTKQGGYSKDSLDFLRENRDSVHHEEFQSSRSFVTTSSNTEEITIVSNTVKMNQSVGSIDRVEQFAEDIRLDSEVDRVAVFVDSSSYQATSVAVSANESVENIDGYIVINIPPDPVSVNTSILKISEYGVSETMVYNSSSPKEVDLSGVAGYSAMMTSIQGLIGTGGGTLVGFSGGSYNKEIVGTGASSTSGTMEIFFDLDNDNALAMVDKNPTEGGNTKYNMDTKAILKLLAEAMRKDPGLKIKITGHTDGLATNEYNKDLSKRRSESMKEWFRSELVPVVQIETDGTGETIAGTDQAANLNFRKVSIEITSGADYFYLKAAVPGIGTADPVSPNSSGNGFVYLLAGPGASSPTYTLGFKVNGKQYNLSTELATLESSLNSSASINEDFSYKVSDNKAYLLHNESKIRYEMYSYQNEDLVIRTGSNREETFTDSESKYLVDDSNNSFSRLKSDSENISNPSTVAAGVSIEGRYSRQFSMEVSGNARVAARIVALPAPNQFVEEIKSIYNPTTTA